MKTQPQRDFLKRIIIVLAGLFVGAGTAAASPTVYQVDKCAALLGSELVENSPQTWSPPSAISEIFRTMSKAKDKNSIHPDKVYASDIDKLPIDTVVYMDTHSMRNPKLKSNIPQSVRFEVRKTEPDAIWLFNPRYGELEFREGNFSDLYGNLYRTKGFRTRSPFLPGEFIQLGWLGFQRPTESLVVINLATGEKESIAKESLPWVGKFIRTISTEEYEVELPNFDGQTQVRLKVKWNEVHHLGIGTGKTLKAVLDPLRKVGYEFSPNETVRFRNPQGKIGIGKILKANGQDYLIESSNLVFTLPKEKIFNFSGHVTPHSIEVDTANYYMKSNIIIKLEAPSGILQEVLDGAAFLASHPDFLKATDLDKIKMFLVYQDLLLPWRRAGNTLEKTGVSRFSEVLCSGAGVCRHNTPLIAAILSEAGISARIYYRMMSDKEFAQRKTEFKGHTWLEVDLPGTSGTTTFAVDPSIGVVKSMSDVIKTASEQPDSSDAIWWSHPSRLRLNPTPLN